MPPSPSLRRHRELRWCPLAVLRGATAVFWGRGPFHPPDSRSFPTASWRAKSRDLNAWALLL